jgi:hypothetical protein
VPTEVLERHAVTSVALYRPSRRQVVVVLAAENPGRVRAALRARYGARLCAPSRWSVSQIDDVLSRLRTETRRWLLWPCSAAPRVCSPAPRSARLSPTEAVRAP